MEKRIRKNVAMLVTPVENNVSLFAIARKDGGLLCEVSDKVFLISGCVPDTISWPENCKVIDFKVKLHYVKQRSPFWFSLIVQIFKLVYIQSCMAAEIVARSKELDIVFCYLGYHFQIPIIVSKLLGKKVISGAWGVAEEAETNYGKIIGRILQFFLEFMYFFSDVIIIQSWRITEHKYLTKWKKKMRPGAQYFGEGEIYRPIVPFSKRSDTIGFVGRFTRRKGILELLEAIPLVLRKNNSIKFVLIGKGLFDQEIRQTINDLDLAVNVDFVGQVRNEDLPNYYNQFKLLVIPSTSEGLPNVMLEAMSCHTPVLATPVGVIPDVISEGETGFLLANNSPEEIARRVIELFDHQDKLEQVTTKAQLVLHENYSYSAATLRYQTLIDELSVG